MQKLEVPHSDWEKFISDFNKSYSGKNVSIFEIAENKENPITENVRLSQLILKKNDIVKIILDLQEDSNLNSDYSLDRVIKITVEQNDQIKINRLIFDSLNHHSVFVKIN